MVDAGNGDGAIGGDVLPAIGQRAGEIGPAGIVADEGAGLEQVGTAGADIGDAEIGAAAGQREAGHRERREAIVGADRRAGDAAGRTVRSECGVAVGRLRAAKACRPHAPAPIVAVAQRRLGEHGIGVALGGAARAVLCRIGAGLTFVRKGRRAGDAGLRRGRGRR